MLVGVLPSMQIFAGWSFMYARNSRTIFMMLGLRSLAFRKRPSPSADCCVKVTMGGRKGSSDQPGDSVNVDDGAVFVVGTVGNCVLFCGCVCFLTR